MLTLSNSLFLLITVDDHPAQPLLCTTITVHLGALLSTIRAVATMCGGFKFATFDPVIPVVI
jgi:hypothetical protein